MNANDMCQMDLFLDLEMSEYIYEAYCDCLTA